MISTPAGYIQANTNGRLHDAREPSLSPLNRGFLYGDAIYEVWRSYERTLFAWSEHWARLQASATALALSLPWSEAELWTEVGRTIAAFRHYTGDDSDVYVRLQIYRGEGAIGLDTRLAIDPGYIILVQPVPTLSAAQLMHGLRLHIARQLRRNPITTLSPAWKTGNYLNNLLCLHEAKRVGADDVVVLNLSGNITEASASNIAFVRDNQIVTPPIAAGILAGITRRCVIAAVAERAGLAIVERDVQPSDLCDYSEAMLLSTTKDVQPVGAIDEVRFAVGPDSATRRLKAAFAAYVADHVAAHPERKC